MPNPSTTPRIPLSDHLADQTYAAICRIGYELGIQPDDIGDCRYLCWLIKCLEHIRDNPRNFPKGKYHTIKTLNELAEAAAKQMANIYYGNI